MDSYSGGAGASNGGMLYHEVQESKLCAVHCVNTVLQGPFFSYFDLAAVALDLDRTKRQMMLCSVTGDFLPDLSHNVSLDGDFSIQMQSSLERTLLLSGFLDVQTSEISQFLAIVGKKPSWNIGSSFSIKKSIPFLPKVHFDDDMDLIDEDSLLTEEDLKKPQLPLGDCEVGSTRTACKNCTCGRAAEEEKVLKLGLTMDQFNNPQSACGNENLCLYGHPNETWEVNLPAEEVPPELPKPTLEINFAMDGMNRRNWLSLIAVHSDCWLLSVAFYLGARLNHNERSKWITYPLLSCRCTTSPEGLCWLK